MNKLKWLYRKLPLWLVAAVFWTIVGVGLDECVHDGGLWGSDDEGVQVVFDEFDGGGPND